MGRKEGVHADSDSSADAGGIPSGSETVAPISSGEEVPF
jgi:hypothetical protein